MGYFCRVRQLNSVVTDATGKIGETIPIMSEIIDKLWLDPDLSQMLFGGQANTVTL